MYRVKHLYILKIDAFRPKLIDIIETMQWIKQCHRWRLQSCLQY